MNKLLITISAFVFSIMGVVAQQLNVVDFHADPTDLEAQVNQVEDLNGTPCALVKLGLAIDDATIEGDIIKTEKKAGEYWVYMPDGSNWLTISSSSFTPLRYEFTENVKSKCVYIMTVASGSAPMKQRVTVELPAKTNVLGEQIKSAVSFDLILVEPGMFKMGATPEQEGADDDERPVHWVKLTNPYYMGETEVTQALWEYVMGYNNSTFQDPNKPVEMISWDDAIMFLKKLGELTSSKFRMPTEAEWEYAARGGNKTQHYMYSGSSNVDEVGWYYNNSQNSTHVVKELKPNELGLYDMSGNVWELCSDYKCKYPDKEVENPVGLQPSNNRVRRGGAWDCEVSNDVRVAFRRRVEQDQREKGLGLRLVLDVSK
ncbi:MAG: SUMF1/EgtB/PvdO family nonheme iron enzyme [Muribaculaceae bacterium]|nr:SUMF1/EgtB/PvdO family nonheme iron enzyme [Muribaculaceae bacterium]